MSRFLGLGYLRLKNTRSPEFGVKADRRFGVKIPVQELSAPQQYLDPTSSHIVEANNQRQRMRCVPTGMPN